MDDNGNAGHRVLGRTARAMVGAERELGDTGPRTVHVNVA
jgi:hypothetical protein